MIQKSRQWNSPTVAAILFICSIVGSCMDRFISVGCLGLGNRVRHFHLWCDNSFANRWWPRATCAALASPFPSPSDWCNENPLLKRPTAKTVRAKRNVWGERTSDIKEWIRLLHDARAMICQIDINYYENFIWSKLSWAPSSPSNPLADL